MKKLYFLLFLFVASINSFAQTNLFTVAGGGAFPSGWTSVDNVATNPIDKTTYYLVDAGATSDVITTASYDLSGYAYAIFNIKVATFGSGTANPAKIDISYDGGATFTETHNTATPASSTYIDGGPITLGSVSSQVVIKISNLGASGRGVRLQTIKLDGYSSDPLLSITSPTTGATFSPITTSVNVALSIANFVVASGTGDGHIHYTVNGGSTIMKYDTTPIAIPTTPGSYTVYVELVDNSHTPIVPAVNATVTFTVASYIVVADLAALRADVATNGYGKYYQISSNPVVTYTRATRNQKYIQDASGAVVIDDPSATPGVITTAINVGDAISGLKGQSADYFGLLEFTPIENVTVASSGNTITPEVVTIADVIANPENYQSELLRINNVTFDSTTTTTFAANQNVLITAPTATIFRPIFSATEVDYIGQPIPTTATIIIAFSGKNSNTLPTAPSLYFVARSLADITLGNPSFNAIDNLKIFVNNNNLFVTTNTSDDKQVSVYNMQGREVVNTITSGAGINVSDLASGIYIVKVTENGISESRKIAIK